MNSSQLGRISVAAPPANPAARANPTALRDGWALEAAIQSPKCKSISGQNGASLSTRTPTAIDPGYKAAIAAAKTPAQGLKSRQATQPTAATAAVSRSALSNRNHRTGGCSTPATSSPNRHSGANRIGYPGVRKT